MTYPMDVDGARIIPPTKLQHATGGVDIVVDVLKVSGDGRCIVVRHVGGEIDLLEGDPAVRAPWRIVSPVPDDTECVTRSNWHLIAQPLQAEIEKILGPDAHVGVIEELGSYVAYVVTHRGERRFASPVTDGKLHPFGFRTFGELKTRAIAAARELKAVLDAQEWI